MMEPSTRASMVRSSCDRVMQRVVRLPATLLEGVSRALAHGVTPVLCRSFFQPEPQQPDVDVPEEWRFLAAFEEQYGTDHPFFYACGFARAAGLAAEESKFLFVYLHAPDHPLTAGFCAGALCSGLVAQFLDANFVSWGAVAGSEEGVRVAGVLGAGGFPFCAVVAPAGEEDGSMVVLQKIEGAVSAGELVEILQGTIEEQGMAFNGQREEEEEEEPEVRRLWEELDSEYLASVHVEKEKEKDKGREVLIEGDAGVPHDIPVTGTQDDDGDGPKAPPSGTQGKQAAVPADAEIEGDSDKSQASNPTTHGDLTPTPPPPGRTPPGTAAPDSQKRRDFDRQKPSQRNAAPAGTNQGKKTSSSVPNPEQSLQVLIRFPNGDRREQSFRGTDTIRQVYKYVDSLSCVPGVGGYRLVSSFPRRVYGHEQLETTLADAGLPPRATFFLELLQ